MKKIKFAAQVFILAAAFPVLFISGISYSGKKAPKEELKEKVEPVVKNEIAGENCFCKAAPSTTHPFVYTLAVIN